MEVILSKEHYLQVCRFVKDDTPDYDQYKVQYFYNQFKSKHYELRNMAPKSGIEPESVA